MTMVLTTVAAGLAALIFAAGAVPEGGIGPMDASARCHIGAYRLSDGRALAVTGFDGMPRDLDYVLSSGEYGHMAPLPDGTYRLGAAPGYGTVRLPNCDAVAFNEAGHASLAGRRIALAETETDFVSQDVRLHGKLVLPAHPKAIVVWIQGSDDDPATNDAEWQYLFPLHDIGVFVTDKRGAG